MARSRNKEDDAEFAEKLVKAAQSMPDSPKLQILLCERAYRFAMKSGGGHVTVIGAMRLLSKLSPDREHEYRKKLLRAHEFRCRAARGQEQTAALGEFLEELMVLGERSLTKGKTKEALHLYREASQIGSRLRSFRGRQAFRKARQLETKVGLARQISRLEGSLAKRPRDRTVRRMLAMKHLIGKDDPKKAASILDGVGGDQEFVRHVRLAAKAVDKISPAECWDLSRWYLGFLKKAGVEEGPALLARSESYCKSFLSRHLRKDDRAYEARSALADLKDRRASRLTETLNDPAYWHVDSGKWRLEKGRIVGSGASRLAFETGLPGDCALAFTMNVLEGMRPRIWFQNGFYIGNEGFKKTIFFYGSAQGTSGKHFTYKNRVPMRVRLVFRGRKVELHINGKLTARSFRPATEVERVEICAGDSWSPGTTSFYDFQVKAHD